MKHGITYGKLVPRPDLCYVKGIEAKLIGISILRLHDLNISFPDDLFTVFNGVPELPLRIVRVNAGSFDGLGFGHLLLTMLGEEVVFDVDKFTFLIHPGIGSIPKTKCGFCIEIIPFEGMATVAMLIDPSIGRTVITEEHQSGMIPVMWVSGGDNCIKI